MNVGALVFKGQVNTSVQLCTSEYAVNRRPNYAASKQNEVGTKFRNRKNSKGRGESGVEKDGGKKG